VHLHYIGFSKRANHPVTNEPVTLLYASDMQKIEGVLHGHHPLRGENEYIQRKRTEFRLRPHKNEYVILQAVPYASYQQILQPRNSEEYQQMRDKALSQLRSGESLTGKDGAFGPLLKEFLEAARICYFTGSTLCIISTNIAAILR